MLLPKPHTSILCAASSARVLVFPTEFFSPVPVRGVSRCGADAWGVECGFLGVFLGVFPSKCLGVFPSECLGVFPSEFLGVFPANCLGVLGARGVCA